MDFAVINANLFGGHRVLLVFYHLIQLEWQRCYLLEKLEVGLRNFRLCDINVLLHGFVLEEEG